MRYKERDRMLRRGRLLVFTKIQLILQRQYYSDICQGDYSLTILLTMNAHITFTYTYFIMPPKHKKVKEPQLDGEDPKASKEQEVSKGRENFGCQCGKWYGSLAAVHTHINNKHSQEKKEYKRKIINPKKIGQAPSNSIRMKDIQYPEDEAELMCHADITLKNIYQLYQPIDKNILIDVTEDLSDSDSEIDEYIRQIQGNEKITTFKVQKPTKRQESISKKVKELKDHYQIPPIEQYIDGSRALESFTISKFKLNLIRELSKFFKEPFAAKVQLSLQLIHTMHRLQDVNKEENLTVESLEKVLDDVWKVAKCVEVKQILIDYYTEWNEIRFNFQAWKERQVKRERDQMP